MKRLDRHIVRELLGPFFFGVAAFTSLMFAGGELFKITELVAEYHASLLTAGKLVVLFLPSVVVLTLPMSMLVAALLGFGRLSGDSEVVALFASGISLYRIIIPVILMSILVTCGSFVLNEVVAPGASAEHNRIVEQLKNEVSSSKKPFMGQDVRDGQTRSFYYVAGGLDSRTGIAHDVTLVQYSGKKAALLIFGREAHWKGSDHPDQWVFTHGYMNGLGDKPYVMPFEESVYTMNKTPEQLGLDERKPDEMSFDELRGYIHMMESAGQDAAEYRVRLYQKLSLPIASLVFALIGAPLGLRPQRSSSAMGLGLSIVIIFGYWVLTHYMSILGENGTLPATYAAFTPTLAGIGAGVALMVRGAK